MQASSSSAAAAPAAPPGAADDVGVVANLSDLQGVPRGGARLGNGRFLFRGQLFWQELLPEHVATNQLEFNIGMGEDTRNMARIPSSTGRFASMAREPLADDDPFLIQSAVCVAEGREDEQEVASVLRKTASWGDEVKLRRLLASCFAPASACSGALCQAAGQGYEGVVQELLRAQAMPNSIDAGDKTALHMACEQGHEGVARLLLAGRADLEAQDAQGRTPCELAREQDLGMMAKRLERDFATAA